MIKKFIALIVEDDPNQADIFTTALQHVDFETITVHDGQKALDWLASSVPHIVILDLNLPKVTGEEILTYIRQGERLREVRVIIATANPRMADPLQEESDIMLVKPISFTQLRDLAERIKQTL